MYLSASSISNAEVGAAIQKARRRITERDLYSEIDRRLAETNVDYFSVLTKRPEILARLKRESPSLYAQLDSILRDPDKIAVLDEWRIKGLNQLKILDAEPAARMLLLNLNLDKVIHEAATCLDHFVGVFKILRQWGHSENISYTGLFHAVYGTSFNQCEVLNYRSIEQRSEISKVIGNESERFVYLFGSIDPVQLIVETAKKGSPSLLAQQYENCAPYSLSENDFFVLSETLVANSLEPVLSGADPSVLNRLRQFEFLRPYLSSGGVAAIDRVKNDPISLDVLKAGLKCK
jgi:hypothetical protein